MPWPLLPLPQRGTVTVLRGLVKHLPFTLVAPRLVVEARPFSPSRHLGTVRCGRPAGRRPLIGIAVGSRNHANLLPDDRQVPCIFGIETAAHHQHHSPF